VHQILDWAAREGARTASQGQIINLTDDYQQIKVVDSNPANLSVTGVVEGYLKSNDQLSITLRLPHDNVRYPAPVSMPGWALPVPDKLTTTLEFYSLQDDPFTVDDVLPSWDPLS
jgi:hypothetical protein